jgi:hypothetical protein
MATTAATTVASRRQRQPDPALQCPDLDAGNSGSIPQASTSRRLQIAHETQIHSA